MTLYGISNVIWFSAIPCTLTDGLHVFQIIITVYTADKHGVISKYIIVARPYMAPNSGLIRNGVCKQATLCV